MLRHEHTLPLPQRMSRVAVIAPSARLRDTLAAVADSGTVEPAGTLPSPAGEALEALRRLEHAGAAPLEPRLLARAPDVAELESHHRADLLAGEAELERRVAAAVHHGAFGAIVGWTPSTSLPELAERVAGTGAAVVELDDPPWTPAPTLIAQTPLARPFRPLVDTYAPTPYADVDPTLFAAASFVLMFGMMFGDVGHGLLVTLLALALRRTRRRTLAGVRRLWPIPFAAGLSAAAFGLLYGECFGPTGLVPRLWLDPIDRPLPLLVAAIAFGGALLTLSYAIGTVNRWREGGPVRALLAPSGIAGTAVFLGGSLAAAGLSFASRPLGLAGGAIAAAGIALLALGYLIEAGRGRLAALEASIEVVDAVVRIGANAISFTRLAAFGMMHAALGALVWSGAAGLWGTPAGTAAAVLVFVAGNALAFALEALVASVQALRLEYYELFSRIFAGREGRPFAPWHIPFVATLREEH